MVAKAMKFDHPPLLLAATVKRADAHGAMQYPPTWHDPGGVYAKFITDPNQLGAGSRT